MSEKKSAKSLANSGQLLENTKSFSGCIVSGFSSVSLEKVPMLRFLLRFPTCNGHFKSLISACVLRRIGSNFKPGMKEGRTEEGGKGGSFFTVG